MFVCLSGFIFCGLYAASNKASATVVYSIRCGYTIRRLPSPCRPFHMEGVSLLSHAG